MRQLLMALVSVAAFSLATSARAQNVYLLDGGAFSNALAANTLASRTRALIGEQVKPNAKKRVSPTSPVKRSATSIRFVSTPAASAIPSIVSRYPAVRQEEVRSTLELLLPKFAAVEDLFGQPHHDLATAISAFIGASYEAASGKEITHAQGMALIEQMRTVLIGPSGIADAPAAEKQKLYEQLAILSMLTGGAAYELKQRPDSVLADKVRSAGRAYLAQLSLNPDKMRFTDRGLFQD